MKNMILMLACLTASISTFAAPAKVIKKKTTTTTETRTGPSYVAPSHHYDSNAEKIRFGAGLGLGLLDGHFTFGANFRGDYPVYFDSAMIRFGAETGIYRAGWSDFGVDFSVLTIPVAGTAQYTFKMNNSDISPYIRAALGIDIGIFKGSVGNASGSNTEVKFHGIVEPGIEFGENNCMFAALPFGTMSSAFLLLPTFGLHF